ncbi:DUF4240 domain-containing protein [Micromonospora echinofusca]|uniref:DUF4240 domain-containing protein n=1 Tax=Micromonospora echinofusca TaxID=47858 RepID=A0ABS3VS93_MICEH|nr:DUF4240 domain-containing protein [Micromonospora echinofusca]MBO4207328.1 DUF4240 domain-containing protein [Micromonospora echinofusca]
MRTDEFWAVIERARTGADGRVGTIAERVTAELADRDPAEIVGFDRHLARVLAASYREDLWGAAYLINGGCSDDGFDYFRGWLMAQGRAVFARAVTEPDSLAELPVVRRAAATGEEFEGGEMLSVALHAYQRATGTELPTDPDPVPGPDLDGFWDFDDEEQAQRRLPRLAALFVAPPEE